MNWPLGEVKDTECNIITVLDKPITFRPYRLSESECKTERELQGYGILTDSNSHMLLQFYLKRKNMVDIDFVWITEH